MIDKSNDKGFTLVEVIVVAILMTVLALGAFSLFNMYVNANRETAAYLKLQSQGEALVDEVAMMVRIGAWVLTMDEDVPEGPPNRNDPKYYDTDGNFKENEYNQDWTDYDAYEFAPDDTQIVPTREFVIRNGDGDIIRAFQIDDDGGVQVSPDGTSWTIFSIGGEPLIVDGDIGVSRFELWYGRKQVRINVTLKTIAGNGEEYFLTVQRGAFRCRN